MSSQKVLHQFKYHYLPGNQDSWPTVMAAIEDGISEELGEKMHVEVIDNDISACTVTFRIAISAGHYYLFVRLFRAFLATNHLLLDEY